MLGFSLLGVYFISASHAATPTYELGPAYKVYNQSAAGQPQAAVAQATPAAVSASTPGVAPNPQYLNDCAANSQSATCYQDFINDINYARTVLDPGVKSLSLNLGQFMALSLAQQLFVITNVERVDRGMQPFTALTAQLNSYALAGAQADTDPHIQGSTLTGGASWLYATSNWAGGNDMNP